MTTKTCKTCPSFMPGDDGPAIMARFKRLPGDNIPMCGRYGKVLGRPGQSEAALNAVVISSGTQCSKHGEALPNPGTVVNMPMARVADPDGSAPPLETPPSLVNCNGCGNLIKSDAVQEKWGYTLPMCAAKGQLIFNPRVMVKDCEDAVEGVPRSEVSGVELLEQYALDFAVPIDMAASLHTGHVDSTPADEYESDKEVTEEDEAYGIRAWRAIEDPDGYGPTGYLPIFRRDHFTPEEQEMIPKAGDDTHPELYTDYAGLLYPFVIESVEQNETVAMVSKPGIGKTMFGYYVAYLMGVPVMRITVTEHMDPDDFFGVPGLRPAGEDGAMETYWQDGPFTRAFGRPYVLIVDEPNTGQPAIWQGLRSASDASKSVMVDGFLHKKHRYCLMYFAMNPAYDSRNLGTNELADADTNRLSPLLVPSPPDEVERKIIADRCKAEGYDIEKAMIKVKVGSTEKTLKTLDIIMKLSEDIREAERDGTFPASWGTRQTVKLARKTRYYPLERAVSLTSLDFYDEDVRELVLKMVRTYVPPQAPTT